MIKVSMNLTERDVENVEYIQELTKARTKAQAVSTALSLTRFVVDQLRDGSDLLVRGKGGDLERVVMPELHSVRQAAPGASAG